MLTDTECKNAKPKPKPYKMSDGKGMHLLVQPGGSKLWRFAYRFDGKHKTMALGIYPAVSPAEARRALGEARNQLDRGADPMQEKKAEIISARVAAGLTFRSVAEEHHKVWSEGKNQAHVDRVWGRMERDAFKDIGDRQITDITGPEILAMIRKVEARGAIDISKRLKQKCSEVFCYAIAAGYTKVDPTAGLAKALKPKPKVEHMAMVPIKQLPALLQSIDKDGGSSVSDITRLALKWTLLTAVRTGETREAKWSEFEGLGGKEPLWRIPKERMKMGREHLIPLSTQAVALLGEIRKHRRTEGGHMFPGPRKSEINSNAMLYALYDLGWRHKQTVHGLRRIFSTVLNERNFNRDWIEIQLAHSEDDAVRGAYNAAEYMPQRRQMMQWWGDYLDQQRATAPDAFDRLFG